MGFFYAVARPPVRSRFDRGFSSSLATAGLLIGLLTGCGQPTTGGTAGGRADTGDAVASPIDRRKLCKRIDAVLAHARDDRRLDASVHGAWQVVHGILAFGRDFPLRHDGTDSAALDYLLDGGRLTGWNLRTGSPGVIALLEEGSNTGQGHPDQWLGYLSQCGRQGIPRDTKLVVGKKTSFTVNDLLTQAQADIRPGREATWTLMALSAYLPIDATWTASDGTKWSTERVVQMEADADIVTSACGGAHRLYGLVAALKKHRAATGHTPEQLSGGWAAAQEVIDERPGTSADVFAKLSATGHIFEVLSLSLDDEQLSEPWVTRAADRLVTMLEQTADVDVECGCLYHAAHGLLLYSDRVCGSTE